MSQAPPRGAHPRVPPARRGIIPQASLEAFPQQQRSSMPLAPQLYAPVGADAAAADESTHPRGSIPDASLGDVWNIMPRNTQLEMAGIPGGGAWGGGLQMNRVTPVQVPSVSGARQSLSLRQPLPLMESILRQQQRRIQQLQQQQGRQPQPQPQPQPQNQQLEQEQAQEEEEEEEEEEKEKEEEEEEQQQQEKHQQLEQQQDQQQQKHQQEEQQQPQQEQPQEQKPHTRYQPQPQPEQQEPERQPEQMSEQHPEQKQQPQPEQQPQPQPQQQILMHEQYQDDDHQQGPLQNQEMDRNDDFAVTSLTECSTDCSTAMVDTKCESSSDPSSRRVEKEASLVTDLEGRIESGESKGKRRRKTNGAEKKARKEKGTTKDEKEIVPARAKTNYKGTKRKKAVAQKGLTSRKRKANGIQGTKEGEQMKGEPPISQQTLESFLFLRNTIKSCLTISTPKKRNRKRAETDESKSRTQIFYPDAPLGQIWLGFLSSQYATKETDTTAVAWNLGSGSPPDLDSGGTLLGRRWLWDEGYFGDDDNELIPHDWAKPRSTPNSDSLKGQMTKILEGSVIGTKSKDGSDYVPIHERAYCLCGVDHARSREENNRGNQSRTPSVCNRTSEKSTSSSRQRQRRSVRKVSSVKLSSVLGEMASGNLNPHTLISCESYRFSPDLRFLRDKSFCSNESIAADDIEDADKSMGKLRNIIQSLEIYSGQVQPFSIRVCPDAIFLADLHSHLSESEVIGFLGGRYVEAERCIYIQAAFPCKSTQRNDAGFTDVEMDPISQMKAGDAIEHQGMSVVGWYHSHPSFQPDPSLMDIHNQGSYQQLFQPKSDNSDAICPFVGLIVGTYDPKNPTAESVMRWFHVTPKETGNSTSSGQQPSPARRQPSIPSSLASAPALRLETGREKERVYFPMNLQVVHRKFRSFRQFDKSSSKQKDMLLKLRQEITSSGVAIRRHTDLQRMLCTLTLLTRNQRAEDRAEDKNNVLLPESFSGMICGEIKSHPALSKNETSETKPNEDPGQRSGSFPTGERTSNKINRSEKALNELPQGIPISSSLQSSSTCMANDNILSCFEQGSDLSGKRYNDHCEESPYLVSDMVGNTSIRVEEGDKNISPAYPLLFTTEEIDILSKGDEFGVTDLVHAGIIWFAVEREQMSRPDSDDSAEVGPLPPPMASRSILDLLLLPPSSKEKKAVTGIDGSSSRDLCDDDVALAHFVDVILSHYSTDDHRIDPFELWTGSGEKGLFGKNHKSMREDLELDGKLDYSRGNGWEEYYIENVMGATPGSNAGVKMTNGHKICACLLKWARCMQWLPYGWHGAGGNFHQFDWDHETRSNETFRKPHIFFVAEVMRLLAARWRESDESGLVRKKNRGRRRLFVSKT